MKSLSTFVRESLITESPQAKDIMRVKDIICKAGDDEEKAVKLAKTMTKLITNKDKAKRRWEAAEQHLGSDHPVTKVFKDALSESLNESIGDITNPADHIYDQSMNQPFWKEVSDKFPEYNSGCYDTDKAVDWLYSELVKSDSRAKFHEKELKAKIHAGIT